MNLHDVHVRESEPEPEIEDEIPTCPMCGGHRFKRREFSHQWERHTIWFREGNTYPSENWDHMDSTLEDSDPWYCDDCGSQVTDELHEEIENRR